MKPKQMMLFAIAVGCGLVAMICAQQVLSGNKAPEQEMVKILVARTDIDLGVPLDESNVGFRDWPKSNMLEGSITTKEEYAGHASKVRVAANQPVLLNYLGPNGQVGVSSMIPKGMTMVTVQVDITQLHGGLLRPGSYVNITAAITKPMGNGRPDVTSVKSVLKCVKVLAVGSTIAGSEQAQKDSSGGAKVETVSLVTYPQKARLLQLAKALSNNRICFELLGEEDKSQDDLQDLDESSFKQHLADLQGTPKEELPEPTKVATADKPTGSSFSEYLKKQPVAPEVVELGRQPLKPTWRIEIYSGEKKTVQEHELPDDPTQTKVTTEVGPSASSQWTSPFMKFFTRKRSSKAAVQDTQNGSPDEDVTEKPTEKSASNDTDTLRQ